MADAKPTISTPIPHYDPTGEPRPLETLPSISDALALLRTFERDHVAELPPKAGAGLSAACVALSAVEAIVQGGEAMYAAHKQASLSPDGMVIAGQEISYATDNGWWGLALGRGQGIVQAFRRDLGEVPVGPPWPLPENDPLPKDEFMEPVEGAPTSPQPPPMETLIVRTAANMPRSTAKEMPKETPKKRATKR